MYLDFYKLREFPFSITCDEKFFYCSPVHNEALANMIYIVQQRKGMVLITGEVGTGKTFVGNMLGSRLGVGCMTIMMKNPPPSGKQLLRALAGQIGMKTNPDIDKLSLLEQLEQHLVRLHARGRLVVLILDESQDLPARSFKEIRLLWNWEQDGQRLIQIVLMGQPELREKLHQPKYEPLRQRIVLSYRLGHLSAEETVSYILHRLKIAAKDQCLVKFTREAVNDIHAASDGIPRLINILCDNALLVGYAKGSRRIDRPIVAEVLRDMTCWELRTPYHPQAKAASISA